MLGIMLQHLQLSFQSYVNYVFRYTYTDPQFTQVLGKLEELFRTNFIGMHPVNSVSWLRHLGFLFSPVSFFYN